MKLLFDFLPFVVFFIVYAVYDFYVASAALMVASVCQITLYWAVYRKVEKMLVTSVILVLIFGTSTIIFHDEDILKWKTTIFSFITASVFLASHFVGKKVILQRMFNNLELPEDVCRRWNMAWVYFLTFLGFLNLGVAYYFSTDVWVYFKLFGLFGLTLIFLLIQAFVLAKHLPKDEIVKSPSTSAKNNISK